MENEFKAKVEPYIIMLEHPITGEPIGIRAASADNELVSFKETVTAFNELIERNPSLGNMVLIGFLPESTFLHCTQETLKEVTPNVVC